MGKLKNQVFIITGSTSGMGKSIAQKLAKEGASVLLSGRNQRRGEELEASLLSDARIAIFLQGDVRDPAYNQLLVKTAVNKFGRLDGLIINAGTLGLGNILDLALEDWRACMQTNLDAAFYLLKYALPELLKREEAKVVVNASIAAFKAFPNHPAYCASKAGLVALARQASVDYGPKVRINCICPGPVDTPLIWDSAKAFPKPEKAVAEAEQATLLKRLGQPEDIAKLCLFLVSDEASWITGSTITIDGGIMAGG